MRNAVFSLNMSLDGCFDHTAFSGGPEILAFFGAFFKDFDLIVYGRKMYELMEPYWPDVAKAGTGMKEEVEFARALVAVDRVVVSKTMVEAEGGPRIIRGDPAGELLKLKQQPGKKISIDGVDLAAQLFAAGLIDELTIVVHPIIVGKGPRLFDVLGIPEKMELRLVDSVQLASGAVALHYVKL